MTKTLVRKWTPAQDAILREVFEDTSISPEEVVARTGATTWESCKKRAQRHLGLYRPPIPKSMFTPELDARIKALWTSSATISVICDELKIARSTLNERLHFLGMDMRHGVSKSRSTGQPLPWNDERDAQLKSLWLDPAVTDEMMMDALDKTYDACRARAERLELGPKARPKRAPSKKERARLAREALKEETLRVKKDDGKFRPSRFSIVRAHGAPAEGQVGYENRSYGNQSYGDLSHDNLKYGMPNGLVPLVPLLKLTARSCRWPIGDPKSDTFGFCGCNTDYETYCKEHQRVAFDTLARRSGARKPFYQQTARRH